MLLRRFFKYLTLIVLVGIIGKVSAQDSKLSFNGYIKDMQTFYNLKTPVTLGPNQTFDNISYNLLHNRLNFKWYTNSWLTTTFEFRNRLFSGKFIDDYPEYASMIEKDNGWMDLSWNWATGRGWFVNTTIDRIFLDMNFNKWNVRVGRQRINWGINLVWNPNDVFNAFDYFDFDYEERPGTDAIKITRYTGVTSSVELVYKGGQNSDHMALAGRYRFNVHNYDFQFIGGWVGTDWVIGTGWSGDIGGAGFRGEISHFEPLPDKKDVSFASTVASVSADYTFTNSLYIHGSVLYNSHGTNDPAGGMNYLMNSSLSAKMLSLAKWSLFGQVSYPVTPLINADFSSIVNPGDGSFYLGPGATLSITDNVDFFLMGQLFAGNAGTEFGDYGKAWFARIKWSF